MIGIDNLEKIRDIETEDRYKVLEFLVKEMMRAKEENPNVGRGTYTVQYNRDEEAPAGHHQRRRDSINDRR